MRITDFLPRIFTNLFVKKEGTQYFYGFASSKSSFEQIDLLEAYDIPEVNSIISLKARTFSNFKLIEVDKDGKEKKTTEGQALIKTLQHPNWMQDGKEFAIQTKTFKELFGNEYLYKLTPFAMDKSLKALFTLPPNIVKSKYDNSIPFYLQTEPKVSYKVKKDDTNWAEIEGNQIIHFNSNRVNVKNSTDKNLLKGESILEVNRCLVNNLRGAYESRGIIINNRGANGAWVNDGKDQLGMIKIDAEEKKRLEDSFLNYGTLKHQKQTIVTNAPVKWVQAGTNNPMNLGLFEETKECFFKLLDAYGVPPEMFSSANGSTFENQRQAEKGLYVRTIIPEAQEWTGGISSEVLTDTSIIADYFHLPVFQEDLKQRGDSMQSVLNALSKALQDQAITIEDYKKELTKFGIGPQ